MIFLLVDTNMPHFITAFCMMLLHSLWQGLLLVVLASPFLFLSRNGPRLKYSILVVLFIVFVGLCGFTFWSYYQRVLLVDTPLNVQFSTDAAHLFIQNCRSFIDANSHFIFLLWLICFSFHSLKIMVNLFYFDVIHHSKMMPPPLLWVEKTTELTKILGIKNTVRLFESTLVKIPVVVGHLKPLILFPIGALSNLPMEQVEAILLHELAHVRRYDYLVNLLQNCVEAVFFFNPGLLLLSTWLREHREYCCDDIALSHTSNTRAYLTALISFKEYAVLANPIPAFVSHRNELLTRVSRILGKTYKKPSLTDRVFLLVSFFILIGMLSLTTYQSDSLTTQLNKISKQATFERPLSSLPAVEIVPIKTDKKPRKRNYKSLDRATLAQELPLVEAPLTQTSTAISATSPELERRESILIRYAASLIQYDKDIAQYKKDLEKYDQVIKHYDQLNYPPIKETYPNQ